MYNGIMQEIHVNLSVYMVVYDIILSKRRCFLVKMMYEFLIKRGDI